MATRSNGRTSSVLERMPEREEAVEREQLTAHDLPYHCRVAREYREAEERLRQAQAEAAAAEGAMRSWMRHVTSAYALSPATDTVDEHGVISRAAPPTEG